MRYRITFLEGLAVVQVRGRLDVSGVAAFHEVLLTDVRWRPGMRLLIDCLDANGRLLEQEDMWAVASVTRRWSPRLGDGQCAIVAGSSAGYGLVRMFQLSTDDLPVEIEAFGDLASACEWLQVKPKKVLLRVGGR